MHKHATALTAVCLVALTTPLATSGQGLRAGVAKATITPDVKAAKVYMAGFDHNRVATGVHDDLYVRCLALAAGDSKLAMCAVDLIGLFYDDVLKVRDKVKAQVPDAMPVIVASTHDHEGPDTMGLWGPSESQSGIDEKYMDWLDDRVASTAVEALRSLAPARMTLARDDHPLLALLQSDSRPPYVKDPHLLVMRLTSDSAGNQGGAPIATLVNWSDHPETLGGRNTLITADYPHWLCIRTESALGGTTVFFNGSIGGLLSTLGDDVALQDPDTGNVAKDGTWRKVELFGNLLGDLVVGAVRSGRAVQLDRIVELSAVIYPPLDNDRFRIGGVLGLYGGRKQLYTDGKLDPTVSEKEFPGLGKMRYAAGADTQTEVDYLQFLGDGSLVAEIATVPGEIYPELVNGGITRYPGADYPDAPFEPTVRAHMKSGYPFVFGLANDELGYIIPKAEWDNQPPWLQNKKDRWYGEINSAGEDVAGTVTRALVRLMDGQ